MRSLFYVLCVVLRLLAPSGADAFSIVGNTTQASINSPNSPRDTLSNAGDSIFYSSPLASHGKFSRFPMQTIIVGKRDADSLPYFELTDLLSWKLPLAFPLSLGAFGQFNSFSLFGGGARDVSMRFNGRTLSSPSFGVFLLDQFPPEMSEQIEILTGADAAVFSDNSSGMAINVQEAIHNTKSPYTRLWYAQGEYNYIASDGIFSQNFAPNWNGTFGFRRQSSGGRFNNSGFDIWNARLGLRYSPSSNMNFTLTELFTNHGFSVNGGLAANSPSFTDPISAITRIADLDERVFRHDITLTASWTTNSGFAAGGSAYFSHENWEINRGAAYYTSGGDTMRLARWNAATAGATIRFEQSIADSLLMRTGGELSWVNSGASVYAGALNDAAIAGYFHIAWRPVSALSLRGGARIRLDQDRTTVAIGGVASLQISPDARVTADVSRSDRSPAPTEGLNLPSEKHLLGIAGLNVGGDSVGAEALMFYRHISSPIENARIIDSVGNTLGTSSYTGVARTILGGVLNGKILLFSKILTQCRLQSYITTGAASVGLPLLYCGLSAQYQYRAGSSLLVGGISVAGMTARRGETFIPQTWSYAASETETPAAFDGVSVFASAKLGNARLRVVFANLFSSRIEFVPYYPDLDRNLRISLSWSFND